MESEESIQQQTATQNVKIEDDQIDTSGVKKEVVEEVKQPDADKPTVTISAEANNIRIAMLGNVDAGKSTLSAVLTSGPGTLDDGNGLLRSKVFNFKHEQNNGRTSSIAHEIMGFDENGLQYVTKIRNNKKNQVWPDIVDHSSKIVHLLDMCGHEKYLKTTMHGLTSLYPDYAQLVVAANRGITKMTKEHIGISAALGLPMFVVFTKIDYTPEEQYKENMDKMCKIMKNNLKRKPVLIKTDDDIVQIINNVGQGTLCPIFSISAVTGEGIEVLKKFISMLPMSNVRDQLSYEQLEFEESKEEVKDPHSSQVNTKFIVDSRYFCKGVGLILGGTVLKGSLHLDQQMMFGPDRNGNFKQVVIKGIHENRVDVDHADEMASCCVHIKTVGKGVDIKSNQIRKGSYLINPIKEVEKGKNPYQGLCVKYFDAHIRVLQHHTTIKAGFQGVLHIGGVRQTVQAIQLPGKDCFRPNEQGLIRFKFKYGVEFVERGAKIMVREGNTKAFGQIKEVYSFVNPPPDLEDNFTGNDLKTRQNARKNQLEKKGE